MKHALDTDVFIDIRPVDALTGTDDTEVCALLLCGVRETPRPGQRNANDSPVHKTRHDFILGDVSILDAWLDASCHSAHAIPPEFVTDAR